MTVKGVDKGSLAQLFVGQRGPQGQVVLSGVVHITAGTLFIVGRVMNQGDEGASKRCLPYFDSLERQASFSMHQVHVCSCKSFILLTGHRFCGIWMRIMLADLPTWIALTTESALLVATMFRITGLKSTSRMRRLLAFRNSTFGRSVSLLT